MKMMKLTYLLAFALAVTLAATGCKNHRPVGVTQLPGSRNRQIQRRRPGWHDSLTVQSLVARRESE